ncbi:MAG: hypothetical protein KBD01_19730 [Acidobacteria bacterium]|nr:hypothetical protein [Acidobacteriota bacterium]
MIALPTLLAAALAVALVAGPAIASGRARADDRDWLCRACGFRGPRVTEPRGTWVAAAAFGLAAVVLSGTSRLIAVLLLGCEALYESWRRRAPAGDCPVCGSPGFELTDDGRNVIEFGTRR